MVPREILNRLSQLRRRERLLRFVWGAACLAATVAAVILVGCLIDFAWDRAEDTPRQVHLLLLAVTGIAAALGFVAWIVAPQFTRLPDDDLALLVEEKHPSFRNRLISAVQLNRPSADRLGMSDELIAVMTREAEKKAGQTPFAEVADHSRLGRSLKVLVPVIVVVLGLWAWRPDLAPILLVRHFLADLEIPRRTRLEPAGIASVVPAGEKVPLNFAVRGDGFDDTSEGFVDVTHTGLPRDRYPLKFSHKDEATGASIFAAEVAPTSFDFTYSARLGDGRMKKPGSVKVVPRPAVIVQNAKTLLPEYCGVTPKGKRYKDVQSTGDIVGIPGSRARIVCKTQQPILKARIDILGPEKLDPNRSSDETIPEVVRRTVDCGIAKVEKSEAKEFVLRGGFNLVKDYDVESDQAGDAISLLGKFDRMPEFDLKTGEIGRDMILIGEFDLKADETGYRIVVTDEHGFENVPPPRRNLRVIPEEPPSVVLLKDYFAPGKIGAKESLEDFAVEGMPVPVGADLRVPYLAEGPYGLGQAWFLYRVLKKTESGNDVVEEEPFKRLPLPEVTGTAKTGPFDPRRGVFENTPPDKGVDFYAKPSPDPERILGRTTGGGRVHFKTKGIPDGKGGVAQLNDGDKIEYCIEIHADNGKHPGRPVVRSETRVQVLGTVDGLIRWISDLAQEERRLRELDSKQKGVFANP